MNIYETVFLARQELTSAQVKELTDQICKILTDNGGKILKTEDWGLRTLAYKINKAKKAHYVLVESETPAPAIHEMERQMRIHDDVMRYMTLRLKEPSKTPSPFVRGQDEDKEAA